MSAVSPSNFLRPILLLLLCSSVFQARATAVEDSLQALVSGAVTAHQRAQALIGMAQRVMDPDPAAAYDHARKALDLAELAGNALIEHRALRCIGEAEERMGLFSEFMKTILRSLQLAQDMGDANAIASDLRALSKAYTLNAMPDKAVEEARNALAMVLPSQNAEAVDEAQRFLLETLLLAGRHEEVLNTAEHFLRKAREHGDSTEEARLSHLIGRSLQAQRRSQDAMTHLSRADRTLMRTGTNAERFELSADIAEALINMGRVGDAVAATDRAIDLLPGSDSWAHRHRITELRYQLALTQSRWEDALDLLREIKARTDSVNLSRLDMQMARMQAIYELERKEQDNAELRSENALQEEAIAGTRMNNRYLLGFLIVLSVLAIGLLFTSRHALRMAQRMKLKNEVIRRQHDEIHAKNLELQRQNMRLAETLVSEEEKEMMIKEIHHRVKNNLQVVDSLLRIQGMGSNDPEVERMLKEAQGRIRSMALVHEHIYRSAGLPNGDLQQHLEQLMRNILVAHGVHDRISISVDAPIPTFPVDTLMPLTLVVNELFTNSVKYAFHGREAGRVTVTVRHAGAGYELLFSDDGVGLGMDDMAVRDRSFGLELVRMLAAQLNGEVRFLKGYGTTVSMTFHPDRVPLRAAS